MTTLKKVATPVLLAGATILAFTFYNHTKTSNAEIEQKNADIEVLQTSMTEVQEHYDAALNENLAIVAENAELKDRIKVLEKTIASLRWKVKQQDKSINKYTTLLEKHQSELAALKSEMASAKARLAILEGSDDTKIQAIKDLAAEKEHLQASVDNLTKMLDEEIADQQDTKLELVASKLREEKIAALKNVIFNTKVNYISIAPSKKEMGRELRKIRRSGKKWKFTNISFDMSHTDAATLEGKEFELKIINITTGEPVPYIESNPMYPESDFNTTGIKFTYEGEPMSITHTNNELKVGQNYRAEISLIEDGQSYPLIHGDQAFIINKKSLRN